MKIWGAAGAWNPKQGNQLSTAVHTQVDMYADCNHLKGELDERVYVRKMLLSQAAHVPG